MTPETSAVCAFRFAWLGLPLVVLTPATAQQVILDREDYLTPPTKIASVLTSDALHNRIRLTNLGPDGEHFLVSKSSGMTPLAKYAKPYVNLGETPIDHQARRSRRITTGNTIGYDLVSYKSGAHVGIQAPPGMTVSGGTFSPDGKKVAFMANGEDGSFLYVADVLSGRSRQVTNRPMLATLTSTFRWTGDSLLLVAVLVPENAGQMPKKDPVANEPTVWLTRDGKTPTRTYRFLLKTPFDKRLLEHLSTGQLTVIEVTSGSLTPVGKPAMIRSLNVSPDGKYFRVTTMQKPFSYFVPVRSFGSKDELWDRTGKVLHLFRERKLREGGAPGPRGPRGRRGGAGGQGGQDGKRSLTWRPDGKGMSFLQLAPAPKKPAKKDAAKKPDAAKKDPAKKPDAAKKDPAKKPEAAKKDEAKKTE